ncbi:MAG: 6-carboxytetrahydropterin synthase [Acidobacteria bacterium]|nr:6-carboxytetrahydropterin synthase [Acidobacteriota bacterium]
MKITRRAEFSASHFCANPALSRDENQALYGEAANPHGHGHNYILEVTLDGAPDPVTGMVMDLKQLKDVIQQEVIEPMDHRFLNHEVPPFDKVIPTTENIAREVWRRLAARLRTSSALLDCVRLYETEDLYVEYFGENAR